MALKLANWEIVSSKGKVKAKKEVLLKKSRVWELYHLIWPREEWFPLWEWEIIEDNNWVCKAKIICRFEWRRWETKIITL